MGASLLSLHPASVLAVDGTYCPTFASEHLTVTDVHSSTGIAARESLLKAVLYTRSSKPVGVIFGEKNTVVTALLVHSGIPNAVNCAGSLPIVTGVLRPSSATKPRFPAAKSVPQSQTLSPFTLSPSCQQCIAKSVSVVMRSEVGL